MSTGFRQVSADNPISKNSMRQILLFAAGWVVLFVFGGGFYMSGNSFATKISMLIGIGLVFGVGMPWSLKELNAWMKKPRKKKPMLELAEPAVDLTAEQLAEGGTTALQTSKEEIHKHPPKALPPGTEEVFIDFEKDDVQITPSSEDTR